MPGTENRLALKTEGISGFIGSFSTETQIQKEMNYLSLSRQGNGKQRSGIDSYSKEGAAPPTVNEIFQRTLLQGTWWSCTHPLTHMHTLYAHTHLLTCTHSHMDTHPGLPGWFTWVLPPGQPIPQWCDHISDGSSFRHRGQGLILPGKGMALVCCFPESFSSVTRSLWEGKSG